MYFISPRVRDIALGATLRDMQQGQWVNGEKTHKDQQKK